MLIGFIGDLHFRTTVPSTRIEKDDFYVKVVQKKLKFLSEMKIDVLICTGDFIHMRPAYVHIIDILYYELKKFPFPIYSIVGNHDTYYVKTEDANIIQTLHNIGILNRLTIEGIDVDNVKIIGLDYGKIIPENITGNILVTHEMLVPPKIQHIPDAKIAKKNENFDIVICGHWHKKFIVDNVYNPGVVIRNSRDEEDANSVVFVFDTKIKTIKEVKIPQIKKCFISEVTISDKTFDALFDACMQIPITDKEKWLEIEFMRADNVVKEAAMKYLFTK